MHTAAEKSKKDKKDEPLDTTKMQPLRADTAAKPTEVSSVSSVVS
ncbi:MAG TPA: hypothetical protein VK893_03325 [Pyrinomonadaceae bacterium]|nr:hypothetical protein [Pyrinomonadaceae bacterium]